jgi:hypothetical protein
MSSGDGLEMQIRAIFRGEFDDGNRKRGDSYWSSNGRNVGADVLTAAVEARMSLSTGDAGILTLGQALERLAAAHETYSLGNEDPDGFGSATFHAIRRNFEALIGRYGADATFDALKIG